jgi:KDO2-lipid IV(A) lauroyltransferase
MRERLFRGVVGLLAMLPFSWVGGLGAIVGRLLYRLQGREARNARVNLGLCFPDMSEEDREALVRISLMHTGRSLAQMLKIWVGPPRDWAEVVDENGIYEAAGRLLERGNGLIVALPHMGNWELIAYLAPRVAPLTALYRPPRQGFMDDLIRRGRARSGIVPVPTDRQGLKQLHAALQRGEMVGILPDQVPKAAGASGVLAPFFGRSALTMTLVSRLARRHQTPTLFTCAIYDQDTGRHRIHYFEGEAAVADKSPEVAAAALNLGVERCVREFPEHYQWSYRRFEIPDSEQPSPYSRRKT